MISTNLPSLVDTKYSIVEEIEKSMIEKYAIFKLEKKEKLTKSEEIRLRRRKRNTDLVNLEQSVVLSEIFYLFFTQNKFNAGVFYDELKNDTYFDKDEKNNFSIPIISGQKWKEHDEASDIIKWKYTDEHSKESDVPLILYQLLNMAEQTNIPPLQQVIDHSKTGKDDEERRLIFNRTLNINLTRHINDWSELRENSRRELLHSSFRTRLKDTLENLSWIKIIGEDKNSQYFYQDSASLLPSQDGPNDGLERKLIIEKLLSDMKKFHNDIQGYDEKYFKNLQDLDENTDTKTNAPQIFRTEFLEQALFPFFFKEKKLKLTIQDIYSILSEYLKRYISGIEKTVSDIVISEEGEEILFSDRVAEKENVPDMDSDILRNEIIEKLNDLSSDYLTKIQSVYAVYFIKERINFYKELLKKQYKNNTIAINKFHLLINTKDNLQNFSPIGINMRVNRIDEIIFEEVLGQHYKVELKIDELIKEVNSYTSSIISEFPESEHEKISMEIYDIFIESISKDMTLELVEIKS